MLTANAPYPFHRGRSEMPLGLPPSFFGLRISGDVGGLTAYTDRYGRNVFYKAAVPQKPPSALQILQRDRFRKAMRSWAKLTVAERTDYRTACDDLSFCMLGHNLWILLCLRHDDELWETLCQQSHRKLRLPDHV